MKDPVKHYKLHKESGCSHVDGPGCDFDKCKMRLEHELFVLERELGVPSHLRYYNRELKNKTMERDWNPVLNGPTYCSPACGAGCTREAFERAMTLSERLAKECESKLGGTWKPRVHENLGWHWSVVQEGTNFEIRFGGYLAQGTGYSIGFYGGTPVQVSVRDTFMTLEAAYSAQVEAVKLEADKWNLLNRSIDSAQKYKTK